MNTFQQNYITEIVPKLQKELNIKNRFAVPKLVKIGVNMGVKDAVADKKNIERMTEVMVQITGQQPKVARAKKSIAGFKLREGDAIGLVVTLRGKRMNDFYQKLVNVVLPRLRDFHGVKTTSFDGKGNYTLGLTEYSVFPEIDPGKADRVQGMEINIVTSAHTNTEGAQLLKALGMPFQKGAKE